MNEITASMAGTVLNVIASIGQEVSRGQVVVVLESMKMEIPIESHIEGKVAEIKISIGDFVNEDDVLLVLE
ncbi:biotin/lipoyl-containing protein [Ferdinandcohnia quinoae]|uniref:Acetyl-CoA carboxylase biotin carboxyl carrier protein subunit n=1 Tax=Fredinandcohnia quinoae TaxID=2918902 RepID=A0AAW5E530_9BACI|nr:biotin/lipoyl-containing protein [Fredinandcohnia sp. SECRCQ15]MCH1623889.1 acetyl-CoA carboxylase biotin carboxyl carrier protein subunit [Fredinandcohnia sp. SECRCQ15]